MLIIIDNGHGAETPGKCSPDGRIKEWVYNRKIARALAKILRQRGLNCVLLVEENSDVSLPERVRRVNRLCEEYEECVFVSIHLNASANSGWHAARGFSAWVSRSAGSSSRRLAAMLTETAREAGLEGNRATPPCGYWEADFYMCRKVHCPAVLTENLFMDNREDAALLGQEETILLIAKIHAAALEEWCRREKS